MARWWVAAVVLLAGCTAPPAPDVAALEFADVNLGSTGLVCSSQETYAALTYELWNAGPANASGTVVGYDVLDGTVAHPGGGGVVAHVPAAVLLGVVPAQVIRSGRLPIPLHPGCRGPGQNETFTLHVYATATNAPAANRTYEVDCTWIYQGGYNQTTCGV
ncbi:MAG: hypothetical protein ACYDBQ_10470 [Thermoplasmatota archaeon]